jgi:hypothetical protein
MKLIDIMNASWPQGLTAVIIGEGFGVRQVMVRGSRKVCLLFGVLALFADPLLKLAR